VHLSPDRTKATIISIPRDSWVDIPDCKGTDGQTIPAHTDMFNSAFTAGGPACTISTIQKLTGIAVTHFLELDFSGFQSMVSALGTVAVCSPQAVWDQGSGLRLQVGINHLDGTQALAYVRARETLGDGSDLGRIRRQQIFLSAVLRQAMNGSLLSNPARLTAFLDAATKAITVDKGTTFSDLHTLASSLQGLDPKKVTFYTAPIANPNYTPPGTTMTGRVLLDASQGRRLYDSVITDTKPVWVSGSNSKLVSGPSAQTAHPTTPTTSTPTQATPASAPPGASLNAADSTCSL
jgi:LCP family protein required for cell wall assembly